MVSVPVWMPPRLGRTPGKIVAIVVAVIIGLILLGAAALGAIGVAIGHAFDNIGSFTLPSPSINGMDVALSPDRTRAYVTEPSQDRLVVIDLASGATTAIGVGPDPSGLAVSPDGSQVWVVDTGLVQPLASSPSSSSVSVVATAGDTVVGTVTVGSGAIDVAFSPDGHRAYVTSAGTLGTGGAVTEIDTASLQVVPAFDPFGLGGGPGLSEPTSVALSPDGTKVWVGMADLFGEVGAGSGLITSGGTVPADDKVVVLDATSGAVVANIPVGAGPFFLALSPDGRDAYVADKVSCQLTEIDATSFQVVLTLAVPSVDGCPFGIAAGPGPGQVVAVTGTDHTIGAGTVGQDLLTADFTTGKLRAFPVGSDPVTVALSADGGTAYVVDADQGLLHVVDTSTGAAKGELALPLPVTTTNTTAS